MRFRVVMGGLLVLACGVLPARGDDELLRQKLSDYLTTCWETGDAARLQADARFAEIEKLAGVDPRTYYAHGLVMMYQRRFDESAQALDQAVRFDEQHLPAWRAKVWLALLVKRYDDALHGMEGLAVAAGKLAGEADNKEAALDAARFLGSAYGFVDGPLSEVAAVASRGVTEKAILAELNEEQRTAFAEARQGVADKFTDLMSERQDSRETAIADQEAEKQKVLADVDKRRAEIATQADELKERRDKIAGELKDELAEIAKLDRPLQAQLATLQTQGVTVQASADSVLFDIRRLEDILFNEEDPIRRGQIRADLAALSSLLRRYDIDLAAIQASIAGVQAQRGELLARQQTAQRNLGGQLQGIERQFAGFQKEERKLAGIERTAKKPSSGSTGKVNALKMTASALKTYEPFPIERERERLLNALK